MKRLILDKLAPLGRVPKYDPSAQTVTLSETSARRFINDLSGIYGRKRNRLLTDPAAYNTSYLGFGFGEALTVLMQDDYQLYSVLYDLTVRLDGLASAIIHSYEQAAILLAHESFGDQLFPHIHHRREGDSPSTLSIFYNLTGTAPSMLCLYPELALDSRAYKQGYTRHEALLAHVRKQAPVQEQISGDLVKAVLFQADRVPHTYSYGDDIWMVAVYDNVELRSDIQVDRSSAVWTFPK